jgi:hypothetical protein
VVENVKPVDNRAERNKNGDGAIRAVIFSVLPDVLTPGSQEFYQFSLTDLHLIQSYCISFCIGCATDILHFQEVANLDQLGLHPSDHSTVKVNNSPKVLYTTTEQAKGDGTCETEHTVGN